MKTKIIKNNVRSWIDVRYIKHWKWLKVEKLEKVDKVCQLTILKKNLDVVKFYTMVQCCFGPKNYQGLFNLGPKK